MQKPRFRLPDGLATALGLGLLLAAGLFAAFWPQPDFSDHERRFLADAPAAPSLLKWETDDEVESYLSDRVPFRRALVAVDASANVLTGRRTQLEAWPVNGICLEKPVSGDAAVLERRLEQMAEIAAKANAPWHVMTPPSHGYLMREKLNAAMRTLYEAEEPFYSLLESHPQAIGLYDVLDEVPDAYYATDHHWTLNGAYAACRAYCQAIGISVIPLDAYEQTSFSPFHGTTYSRSGIPFAQADTLRCAQPVGEIRLNILDTGDEYDTLIFPEKAETYDGYAVYMNGNHGLLEILNPAAPEGTLLVFKDSFANCALPLLSAQFSRIVAVDARYYAANFSDAIAAAGQADQVLFLYSLDSLINDTVVARKMMR